MALTAPVLCEPLTLLLPAQLPEAAHEAAFWLVHDSVAAPPAWTVLGFDCSVTAGAAEVTVTVVDCDAEPPGPVQVISNSVSFDSCPVAHVPLSAMSPCQPPVATHWVALSALQCRVELPELLTVVGEALKVTEGAAYGVTVTWRDCVVEPPLPVQVRV